MKDLITKYVFLSTLRNYLKSLQQISWDISNFEKENPFSAITEDEYKDYEIIYSCFINRITDLAKRIKEEQTV